jgi:hypothetical protein
MIVSFCLLQNDAQGRVIGHGYAYADVRIDDGLLAICPNRAAFIAQEVRFYLDAVLVKYDTHLTEDSSKP